MSPGRNAHIFTKTDIWLWRVGRAESRGNGEKDGGVNDNEWQQHHSPVSSPTEELCKDKRRSDDSERRERTRPGVLFVFYVWQSSMRGCRFYFVFVYFVIKVFNCSPVPASFFPYLRTGLHWCRNPEGRRDTLSDNPHCWGGSRCWGGRAAGRSGDCQWLPEAVVLE